MSEGKNFAILLGCGSSMGVPSVSTTPGGFWGACDPTEPKNRRRRSALYVCYRGKRILVDAGPDIRNQLLDNAIGDLDAILITHAHADHTGGLDCLRSLVYARGGVPLPIYGDAGTVADLQQRFSYLFRPSNPIYNRALEAHVIEGRLNLDGVLINVIPQRHGEGSSLGFRFGSLAYSIDFNFMEDTSYAMLDGVETWIVDCLGKLPKPTHNHLPLTLRAIQRVQPKRAILSHMGHELDYQTLYRTLPKGVEPGYDGLHLEF
ncbi:MAG: MBL fold metallo-hydrolase [Holosporales bacterium]